MYSLKCKFNKENKEKFNIMLSSIETIAVNRIYFFSYQFWRLLNKQVINLKMILEIILLAKEYSKISHKSCYVQEINLDDNRDLMPMPVSDSGVENEPRAISIQSKAKKCKR